MRTRESLWWRFHNHGREPVFYEMPPLSLRWRRWRFQRFMEKHGESIAVCCELPPVRGVDYLVEVSAMTLVHEWEENWDGDGSFGSWQPVDDIVGQPLNAVSRHVAALVARTKPPRAPARKLELPPITEGTRLKFVARNDAGVMLALVERRAGDIGAPSPDDTQWIVEEMIEITGLPDGANYCLTRFAAGTDRTLEEGTV